MFLGYKYCILSEEIKTHVVDYRHGSVGHIYQGVMAENYSKLENFYFYLKLFKLPEFDGGQSDPHVAESEPARGPDCWLGGRHVEALEPVLAPVLPFPFPPFPPGTPKWLKMF